MALTVEPGALLALHTEANRIKAAGSELALRIRSRAVVAIQPLRSAAVSRGVHFRDLVTTSGVRHAGQLAGHGIELAALATALDAFGRALLTDLSRGDLRAQVEAEIRRELQAAPDSAKVAA